MSKIIEKRVSSSNNTGRSVQNDKHGLIILGNSGVGKSFLANILAGYEAFDHAFSSESVTRKTEYVEVQIGDLSLVIFNIPGLMESEQERIELNKKEIDKAFKKRPNSVIIFVFGHQNGRIRDEDFTAFKAINAAYPFQPESLVMVINALPKNRPNDYEGTALVLFQKVLVNTNVNSNNLCFLDAIDPDSMEEKQNLKENLLKVSFCIYKSADNCFDL
jgi:predicted GTPase